MSILDSIFGRSADPQAAASQYLDQIPGVGHDAYDPYIQRGQRAGGRIEDQFESLLSDPTALMNHIMENYQTSDQYGYQKDQLGRELGATAAAGGVAGTPYHQQQQGEMVQGLLSKDMSDYLSNALGLYRTGLSGEQDLYGKGMGASSSLADMEGGALSSKAGLAYEDAKSKNANRNALISSLLKAAGTGAGFMMGGPMGGAMGGKLAGPMSGSPYKPWNDPG